MLATPENRRLPMGSVMARFCLISILYCQYYKKIKYMQIEQLSSVKVIHVVSRIELKRLLISIFRYSATVGFRYRLIDDVWRPDFMRVSQLTERGVILEADHGSRLLFISNLSAIAQFELNNSCRQFIPYLHYNVFTGTAHTSAQMRAQTGLKILK